LAWQGRKPLGALSRMAPGSAVFGAAFGDGAPTTEAKEGPEMADKQAVIARIRDHYEAEGISLDALTDREIELGVRQLAAAVSEAGTSKEEAANAMRQAVEAAKQRE
jgi:hypothetical protein